MRKGKDGFYAKYIKCILDFFIALFALIVLSPALLILTVVGAIVMKGNPFFVQKRPGMINKKTGKERIVSYLKFRSMTNVKDASGNMLPDDQRLGKYGKFLRASSLDELPSLANVLLFQCALIGPRPLLVRYIPYFTEEERHRHDVRPGLTGYAQVHGRNAVGWDEKLQLDLDYISKMSFMCDLKIVFDTIKVIISHRGIDLADIGNLDSSSKRKAIAQENMAREISFATKQ